MATVSYDGGWQRSDRMVNVRRRRLIVVAMAVPVAIGGWWLLRPAPHVDATGAVASAIVSHGDTSPGNTIVGAEALRRCRESLIAAETKLQGFSTMTAVFQKQERIDGALQPLNVMDLKVRREPLSIYMKWQKPDEGQEVIWRDGANDGKILVCPAGWRRKVMPLVKVDPNGDMALAVSKRPITNSGIWSFTHRLLAAVDGELTHDPNVDVRMTSGDEISGHPCDKFVLQNPRSGTSAHFDKAVIFIDQTLGVPVAFELYGRGKGDQVAGQLDESYLFRDLQLGVTLSDVDFDYQNPAYEFTSK